MSRVGAAALAWAALASTAAQAGAAQCLTPSEADAVIMTALPDVLGGVSRGCAAVLPPDAALIAGIQPFLAPYREAAARRTAEAARGFNKIADQKLDTETAETLLPVLKDALSAKFAESVKSKDCPRISEFVDTVRPLPPENMARLVRLLLTMGEEKRGRSPLPICRTGTP